MGRLRTVTGGGWSPVALAVLVAASGLPQAAGAETAWVRGEVRLNLRTGPTTGHRIVGGVKTGDRVEIVGRAEDWTRIREPSGLEGWIPAGYLDPEPPAVVRVDQLATEVERLRRRNAELSEENERLTQGSEASVEREAAQRAELERLATENRELRAGARWPHWIAGASILAAGMLVGAILARSGRRSQRRIKL